MVKIATWNVNSIKARLPRVIEWLTEFQPDIACFQELRTSADQVPVLELEALGYQVALSAQKGRNGVAILAKRPFEVTCEALPGDSEDIQARYIEAQFTDLRVGCLYLPNGNPTRDDNGAMHEKFTYKLAWMDRLVSHAKGLLETEEAFVLAGDYNIIPSDADVYDPAAFEGDALTRPESRARYRTLLNLGLTDAFGVLNPGGHHYSYWDYKAGAWQRDNGIRIDHLLLSPQAADRLRDAGIDRKPRGREKASDHTPVWCELTD